jgi:hypothetical protein
MSLYWTTVFLVAFLWTFGIGLQTKAIARSKYLPAAILGVFLCGVQIFIVRAAVFESPWFFFVIGGTAYALGNIASIWVFDRMARPVPFDGRAVLTPRSAAIQCAWADHDGLR